MDCKSQLIKSKLPISEIVGQKVTLINKGGYSYAGLCPFHKEKTPSFFVNDEKKIFHCFGCGVHGDIFTFVMQSEGISYKEALCELSKLAGLSTNDVDPYIQTKQLGHNHIFHKIYEKASEFYCKQLFSNIGEKCLNYIFNRGIREETIRKFHLGYSPYDSSLLVSELKKHFSLYDLYKAKIIYKGQSFDFDPFYDRLIFPIKDEFGKIVGFGGRKINQGDPKYINSADNPIFKKSEILYGYNIAKNSISKEKGALIVEGYIDVISLHNIGITNVVSVLGTTLQLNQLEMLWKYCREPIICFDNDLAGINAAKKVAYANIKKISHDKSLRFMNLIGGKDPDEVLRNHGKKFFEDSIAQNSISLSDYIFQTELDLIGINTPENKLHFKFRLDAISRSIFDHSLSQIYLHYFRKKYYNLISDKKKAYLKPSSALTIHDLLNTNKNFNDREKNKLRITSILLKYPHFMSNNEIVEEFNTLEMTNDLDNIRKILLDFSFNVEKNFKNFLDCYITKKLVCSKTTKLIKSLIENKDFESESEAKKSLARLFGTHKIVKIKKEISIVKNQLLVKENDRLMKKMLYLKECEKQIMDIIIS